MCKSKTKIKSVIFLSKRGESAAKKAAVTRKKNRLRARQVEIGHEYGGRIREKNLAVRPFLIEMKRRFGKTGSCVVCGELMRNTLDTHHLDGNEKNNDPSNLVTLCASCHRIIDKARSPQEALQDFEKRKREQE